MTFDADAYFEGELLALRTTEAERTLSVWRRYVEGVAARMAGRTRAGVVGMDVSGTLSVTLETGLPANLRLECSYPYRSVRQYPVLVRSGFVGVPLDGSCDGVPDQSVEYLTPAWLAQALIAGQLPTHPCGAGCGAMAAFDDNLCPDCSRRWGR